MTRSTGEKRASRTPDERQASGALAAGLLLFAFLLQVAAASPAEAGGEHQGIVPPPEPASPNHAWINLLMPNGGENWTTGTQVKFIWQWVHDPDPVHKIDLQLSLVSCLGDRDKSFYTIAKGLYSDKKNGQFEEYSWILDPETPSTHRACGRIIYYSPSNPGENMSKSEFTIWNPSKPLAQLEVDIDPDDAQVPSGGKVQLVTKVGISYKSTSFPIFLANVSMEASLGNFTKNTSKTDLAGHARFQYNAPKVTNETNVSIKACATEKWFRPSCAPGTITLIPPSVRKIFPEIAFDPDPPFGRTANNVTVTVRNVTDILPGASVTVTTSNGTIDPGTGTANETGVFPSMWTPPDILSAQKMCVTAHAVYSGHPPGSTTRCVDVQPRLIPRMFATPYHEGNGVLDSGTVRIHVVVTDSNGYLQGAFVNVVDPAGAVLDPASSGETNDRGEFVADLRPPKLAANDTARSIALKINVTEPEHQPIETQLFIDVYRDPGILVRPSVGYYGAVGVVLSASLLFSFLGFLKGGAPGGTTLMADGGEDETKEKKGGEGRGPEAKDGDGGEAATGLSKEKPETRARPPPGPRAHSKGLPLTRMFVVAGILLALVGLGLATPAAENGLVDAGMQETLGSAPPQFNPVSDLAIVSTEVGITVVEIARFNRVITMVHTGYGAHDLELDESRKVVYVSNTRDGTVSAVDLADPGFPILATMSVGRQPRHIALTADGARLWSVNDGDPSVSVIDTSKMIEIARIPLAAPAGHGDIALVDGKAFVTSSSGKLFRLDQSSVLAEIPVSKGAHEIELIGQNTLFVGSKSSRSVDVVDASSGALRNTTAIPGNASFVVVTPAKDQVFVGLWDAAAVARLDPATGALLGTFETVEFPTACLFTLSEDYAYIGSGKLPWVFVNRLDNYSVEDRLQVGGADPSLPHPRALFASRQGQGFDMEFTASGDGSTWWGFEPHLLTHAIHSGGAVGANPIDVVIL